MRNTIIGIIVVAVLGIGSYAYFSSNKSDTSQMSVQNSPTPTPNTQIVPTTTTSSTPVPTVTSTPVTQTTKSYTLADVAKHSSSSDCWTAVNGKVYNVTAFIPDHPGGRDILKACGKDGTKLFMGEDEHIEQNAQATLDTFFIGTLKTN